MSAGELFLVFTDLDGSLLDHNTYSYLDARPQLYSLERLGIPLIPATSKTRLEIEELRAELGHDGPFIVENGAAVFIPSGHFAAQPPDTVERDGYWVHEFSPGRSSWLELLVELQDEFGGEFDNFFRAGPAGIARMTGLTPARAELANQRDYTEPLLWQGSAQRREAFVAALREGGATVLQGGRFLAVSGACDKGRALVWLRGEYHRADPGLACHDLAIGDSPNDCAMLEAAETALLVRSPAHDFPPLVRTSGVIHSQSYGPAGWAEGVAHWLHGHLPHH